MKAKPRSGVKSEPKIELDAEVVKKRKKFPIVVLFVVLALVGAGVGFGVCWATGVLDGVFQQEKPQDELPQMEIKLANVPLEAINVGGKDIKYEGNEMTLTVGGETQDFYNVEIKGRGNTTWTALKRPYQIKLGERADLLGLGKARKWILLANYFDRSYLRNDVAFWVANELGDKYAIDGKFVELSVDEAYYGLYYMTRKVNIGKEEVDLRDPMGIVMELDNLHQDGDGYTSREGDYLTVSDVVAEDNLAAAEEMFMTAFNQLERAARKGDWATVQEVADVDSFARYYLLSEFTNNPDAYVTSFYLYKDGAEDKIHAGPGWDFDLALANRMWGEWGEEFWVPDRIVTRERAFGGWATNREGEEQYYNEDFNLSRLLFRLMDIPEFEERVRQIWQEKMAGREDELLGYITAQADYIRPAVERDMARWKLQGFDTEVEILSEWIRQRYEYFDEVFGVRAGKPDNVNGGADDIELVEPEKVENKVDSQKAPDPEELELDLDLEKDLPNPPESV